MSARVPTPGPEELSPVLRVCEAIGRLVEFWGFSRHLGRIWTLLYLSPRSAPAATIQEELQISAGAASTALKELQRWGVVKRVWVPGERKDFFEAETDLWKMVSRVIEEREKKLIDEVRGALEGASDDLEMEAGRRSGERKELARFRFERVEELRRLARSAETILQAFVKTQRLDASPIARDLGKT